MADDKNTKYRFVSFTQEQYRYMQIGAALEGTTVAKWTRNLVKREIEHTLIGATIRDNTEEEGA